MNKHIIFLDTSIFEAENFLLGRNLNHLAELSSKKQIELKITDIVYREIIQRIKENIVKTNIAFKKAYTLINGEGKIFKNLNQIEIPKIEIDATHDEILKKFNSFLEKNKIEIIDSQISNFREVFDAYFENSPPFHDGKKKSEFPDAFAFSTIKEWSKAKKRSVFFLSNDSDFNGLSDDIIDCSHSLSTILDLIVREINEKHALVIQEIYEDSKPQIISSLEKSFIQELSDAVFDELESEPFLEDIDIQNAQDLNVDIMTAVLNEIHPNKDFSYEIESNITFFIDVEYTDLSTGFYDKEDGIWYGQDRITETKEFLANVISIADFSFDIAKDNGFFYMINNFSINYIEEL